MIVFGDGLNTTSEDLGYDPAKSLSVGDIIEVAEWDEELGDVWNKYKVYAIEDTEDGLVANVYYVGE